MPTRSLETQSVRKEYPGTVALRDISVRFEGGRIHAIIGKNGAGKSTLVKVLSGAIPCTSGTILVTGEPVQLRSPKEALLKGIVAVYQELSLVPEMSVAENIFLGRLPRKQGLGRVMVDWPKVFGHAEQVLERLQVDIDVRARASSLGVARQQVVEIARAMSYNPSVLMLDEPTSALSRNETEHLFALLRTLAAQGVVLLYITHRLQDLFLVCDRLVVLYEGRRVAERLIGETTIEEVVNLIVGRKFHSPSASYQAGAPL